MKRQTLLAWSSGKDSAWALHVLKQDPSIEIRGLFSVVNQKHDYVPMHTTRLELLRQQADSAGLPLEIIYIPEPCSREESSAVMSEFVSRAAADGIKAIAFGDLFLEDIRADREEQMTGTGIDPLFPLWLKPTAALAEEMLSAGLKAYVTSVDLKKLPKEVLGKPWSREMIAAFPEGTDPCGEYGEVHTVVVNGPMFGHEIHVQIGEITTRDGFGYADVIPM